MVFSPQNCTTILHLSGTQHHGVVLGISSIGAGGHYYNFIVNFVIINTMVDNVAVAVDRRNINGRIVVSNDDTTKSEHSKPPPLPTTAAAAASSDTTTTTTTRSKKPEAGS